MRSPFATAMGLIGVLALAAAALVLLPHRAGHGGPAVAVAATGHPEPVTLPTGPVAVGAGATGTGPAGVPLGFSHDSGGAIAAGTAWLTIVEGAGVLDTARRAAILGTIGDPGFVTATGRRLAARAFELGLPAAGRPAAGYLTAVARPDRGAYKVINDDTDRVQIEVWYPYQLEVVAVGAQPGPAHWVRAWLPLRWDPGAGDWRLSADLRFAAGPDPHGPQPSFVERTESLQAYGAGWHLYAGAPD